MKKANQKLFVDIDEVFVATKLKYLILGDQLICGTIFIYLFFDIIWIWSEWMS